jgi:diguanylate cyclase (GGDEF)-like protein
MTESTTKALRLAGLYIVFGGLWILFTDLALESLIEDPARLTQWQTWKGWFYVAVTALLVFVLVLRLLHRERELSDRLKSGRALMETVFEGSRDAILLLTAADGVRLANHSGRELLGMDSGTFPAKLPAWLERRAQKLLPSLISEGRWTGEIWVPTADGLERPYLVNVSRVEDEARFGPGPASVWVLTDISELRQTQEQLEDLAWFDPLTRLPNRRLIQRHLAQAIERAPSDLAMGLLYIDLDNFKDINDSLGHPVGDEVLVAVSERLQGCLGSGHRLAHVGADEFVIVIERLAHPRKAVELAQQILNQMQRPIDLADHNRVFVGVSIGISHFPEHARDVTGLIQYADAAMNQAKKLGRSRWQVFAEPIIEGASKRIRLDARLRDALDNDDFELQFQPILAIEDGRITGFEALLRWSPEDIGPISPADFIPVAEATGLIVPIGEWIMQKACEFAASLPPINGHDCSVAVNLSAAQLTSRNLVEQVRQVLEATGLAAERLHLEITESTLMEQGEQGKTLLHDLRALGVRIALDDFGTGYSSLAYLKHFEVDALKIDRSFVDELDQVEADRELVTAILALAACFGLEVIAEGVERREQLEILAGLGCNGYQGWLFSPALPSVEARKLLSN